MDKLCGRLPVRLGVLDALGTGVGGALRHGATAEAQRGGRGDYVEQVRPAELVAQSTGQEKGSSKQQPCPRRM
jgi:hypothetical protein